MKIDLSAHELDLLHKALEHLLTAPTDVQPEMQHIIPGIFGGEREKMAEALMSYKKADAAARENRQRQITLLRAKFYQAEAVASEHNVEDHVKSGGGGQTVNQP